MKSLVFAAALLGGVSLVACDDGADAPIDPAPEIERQIEPIEEETAPVVEEPAPYVDDMGGDLGTFRQDNDSAPVEPVIPEVMPDAEELPPTVPETTPER